MKVVNYVQIDFSRNKDITVPSIQYDSGTRWVMVKLYNNGVPIDLHDLKVFIMAVKPDGKEVFNNCNVIDPDDGLIKFEITEQMGFVKGEVECQIKLMDQDRLLSSDIFKLNVNKSLSFENSESTNQLTTLVDALYRVEHLDAELSGEFRDTFNASQLEREESFNDSQMDREEVFNSSQLNREETFNVSETERENIFDNSQVNHEERFNASQAEREDKFNDKLDQFEERFLEIKGEKGDKGDKGDRGLDGRGVELGVYGGQVKWRYAGQAENVGWTSLISLDSLKGAQGPIGLTGPQGPKGDKGDQGEVGPIGPQGEKGEKGDSGVIISDMVDYMGNQHESLKAKNDADVDWLLREINTTHYEGQYITATDSIEGRAKSAILKGQTKYMNIDDQIYDSYNIFTSCTKLINQNIDSNGELIESGIRNVVDYIAINEQAGVKINGLTIKNLVFYDESRNKLSTISVNTSAEYTLNIPSNAKYFRFSYDNTLSLENASITLTTLELVSVRMPILSTMNEYPNYHVKEDIGNFISPSYVDKGVCWKFRLKTDKDTFLIKEGDDWAFKISYSNTNKKLDVYHFNSDTGIISTSLNNVDLTSEKDINILIKNNRISIWIDGVNRLNEFRLSWSRKSKTYYSGEINELMIFENLSYTDASIPLSEFKTNILSTPEDVELGSVGDVKDELDLVTGELTQRTDIRPYQEGDESNSEVLTDMTNTRYKLPKEVIKTVDLSGQKVYSYDGTTHYICGSEDGSLIPSLSIDVPTNLPALVSRQRATIESQKEQIQTLEVENEILTNEIQRVDEKGEQADLEQLSMTWEIDYRVSELEWFVEDNISSTMTVAETMNLKSGGNTMALSRFEQAKILILAGAYNRETLEKQLTNYLKRGYLTTEEYDELIALMDAKELVSEN